MKFRNYNSVVIYRVKSLKGYSPGEINTKRLRRMPSLCVNSFLLTINNTILRKTGKSNIPKTNKELRKKLQDMATIYAYSSRMPIS